jgi:hypothetical protein
MWRDALATEEPTYVEARLLRADGQYRWFVIYRVALRDENGKVMYDVELTHKGRKYEMDINGDGTYGDATGPNPTLTGAQLQALGIGSVSVRSFGASGVVSQVS